jgi:hypothetical protein
MVYIYDACDQISDFCHQQLLKKCDEKYLGRTEGQTDRGKTVYPPPPSGSGGIIIIQNTTLYNTSKHLQQYF